MKFMRIDDVQYGEIIEAIEGGGAHILWNLINRRKLGVSSSYEDRKFFFLSIMYRLMKEGRVKLASDGKFLEGTIEEQVQRYSDLWPKEESLLDKVDFQFTADADGNLVDLWPEGGFVWVYEDGSEEWSYTA